MWNVSAGLDWESIAELSRRWANRQELAMAKSFVEHLDALSGWESGRIYFDIKSAEPAGEARAAELQKAVKDKLVLGLPAELNVPERPEAAALACRVQIKADEVLVQLAGSDGSSRGWVHYSKFSLRIPGDRDHFDAAAVADAVAEGLLSRLVHAQLVKGPRAKGKLTHRIRIENASPLRLNGLAAVGSETEKDAKPRVLAGISIPPRRSVTVPASEEIINKLGMKHGIRVTAIDLSGL